MSITWDTVGERYFETGVKKGVLFPERVSAASGHVGETFFSNGVAWNGLIKVSEKPSGGEPQAKYADNIKYLNLTGNEDFGITIESFTYPNEFCPMMGIKMVKDQGIFIPQQTRKQFGFCYRTEVGNDVDGLGGDYKLHLVYNCLAKPSEISRETIGENPDAITFSWEATTTPEPFVPGVITAPELADLKPGAHLILDSRYTPSEFMKKVEDAVYGRMVTGEPGSKPLPAFMPNPSYIISNTEFPVPEALKVIV